MCPLLPISVVTTILLFLIEYSSASLIEYSPASSLKFNFSPEKVLRLPGQQTTTVSFNVSQPSISDPTKYSCNVTSSSEFVATVNDCHIVYVGNGTHVGSFNVTGNMLGYADASVDLIHSNTVNGTGKISISVVRKQTFLQHMFIGSLIILVSLNYVNMGCALNMSVVKEQLKKPVGPVVGFVTQYAFMPVLAYFTALNLLSEPYLQLGLFTFGCSPGGGASNMWSVLLQGNLNLSITMTFISNIAAFAMMPLWLFTLGKVFFKQTAPTIPFQSIITGLVGMLIPLGIGLIMQRYCPKGTAFCRKILAPASIFMIIFIIIFGTFANLYMFSLFTWQIMFAATVNVWTGFLIGVVSAKLFGLPWSDAVTVMVETGIQNTGISIVLLGVSLPQPDADMAAVIPVAASIITPIPLLILYIAIKICCRKSSSSHEELNETSHEDVKYKAGETPLVKSC